MALGAKGFSPPHARPIGILGGGQLARMLALRGHDLGIPVAIYSEHVTDPAAQVTSLWHQGKASDPAALKAFLASCHLATFESEFLDAGLLERLSAETGTGIFPEPAQMGLIQDRLSQKEILVKHGLPTSPFMAVRSAPEAAEAFARFGGKVVFKKRRFGYDGYGTFIVKSAKDLRAFTDANLAAAKEPLGGKENGPVAAQDNSFIAEAFLPFARELAVILARSNRPNSKAIAFPFVETFQENSRCLWVKGPLKSAATSRLLPRLLKFLNRFQYCGVLAIELFEMKNKELIINELAPRVHNSGHYSADALTDDQFAVHLKAVLGKKLVAPELRAPGFAMWNLLGSSEEIPTWDAPSDVYLHWYGKQQNRLGRKMGHLNANAGSPNQALKLLKKARKKFVV